MTADLRRTCGTSSQFEWAFFFEIIFNAAALTAAYERTRHDLARSRVAGMSVRSAQRLYSRSTKFIFSQTLASKYCNDVRQRDSHAANGTFQW